MGRGKAEEGTFTIGNGVGVGYRKGELGARMQGSCWALFNEEGLDVRWGGVVEGTVCENEDFKWYSLPDWEPMEFNQDEGDMLMDPGSG